MTAASARDLAAARARVNAVIQWIAAREAGSPPGPATIDAAASILAAPPHHRHVSASVHPATVWQVRGHMVAIYHSGSPSGPAAAGECSCPSTDVCEHLLVALTGTKLIGVSTPTSSAVSAPGTKLDRWSVSPS
jgi:hypothetical protein